VGFGGPGSKPIGGFIILPFLSPRIDKHYHQCQISRVIPPQSYMTLTRYVSLSLFDKVNTNEVLSASSQQLLNDSVPPRPLIDEIVPMSNLREEYENGSATFVNQIDWLTARGYDSVRRTRGDGDCFYRCKSCARKKTYKILILA
jgi:hypothetical protein